MAKQRAAFLRQVEERRKVGRIEALHSKITRGLKFIPRVPAPALANSIRNSLVLIGILAAVFAGIVFGNPDKFTKPTELQPSQGQSAQRVPILPAATYEITKTTCTPDSALSKCSTSGFDKDPDQVSWVSKSADSWIKIDTGQTASIHMVEFDKEYLYSSSGEFTIALALTDNQYKQVFDSKSDDPTGVVAGAKTVQVSFEPELARYVLITVTDPGMVINEVRAFASILPPTSTPDQLAGNTKEPPLPSLTPSNTPLPTRTKTATPTSTPSPSNTPTATSTHTPLPSSTPTAVATNTPLPTNTQLPTSTPLPTSTSIPTDTSLPTSTSIPTNTSLPTYTPLPTSTPLPTNTPLPTSTRLPTTTPLPASTPLPTNTPLPTSTP